MPFSKWIPKMFETSGVANSRDVNMKTENNPDRLSMQALDKVCINQFSNSNYRLIIFTLQPYDSDISILPIWATLADILSWPILIWQPCLHDSCIPWGVSNFPLQTAAISLYRMDRAFLCKSTRHFPYGWDKRPDLLCCIAKYLLRYTLPTWPNMSV